MVESIEVVYNAIGILWHDSVVRKTASTIGTNLIYYDDDSMLMAGIKETTEELIRFKTVTGENDEIRRCRDFIKDHFKDGFYIKEFDDNGVPSLLVTTRDTMEPRYLLMCHMDVVPAPEECFTPKEKDGKLYGRGAYDDKGPLAIAMELVKELPEKDVGVLVTGDEEKGGMNGAYHVFEQGLKPGFAIVLDGGEPNSYVTASKGIVFLKIIAKGKESHGSRPWQGENAIEKLMSALSKIKEAFPEKEDDEHWYTTVNISKFEAGDAINKVPGEAVAHLDIRHTEEMDPESIKERISQAAGDVEVETIKIGSMFLTDRENEDLKRLLDSSNEFYGEEPELIRSHGGSDARFLSPKGIPCVITDPKGEGMHQKDECLDIRSAEELFRMLKGFLEENA